MQRPYKAPGRNTPQTPKDSETVCTPENRSRGSNILKRPGLTHIPKSAIKTQKLNDDVRDFVEKPSSVESQELENMACGYMDDMGL